MSIIPILVCLHDLLFSYKAHKTVKKLNQNTYYQIDRSSYPERFHDIQLAKHNTRSFQKSIAFRHNYSFSSS